MRYVTRVLDPLEWPRLKEAGGPFAEIDLPDLAGGAVIAAEVEGGPDDGRIVAYWVLLVAVHAEPLWIAEGHRGHVSLARGLLTQMQAEMAARKVELAFGVVEDTQTAAYLAMVDRAGFQKAPGQLYFVRPGGS